MTTLLFPLLTLQALLGACDNLWHHEITERLPAKRSAAGELTLHAAREFIYGVVLLQLAWYELHGVWALLLAAVLIAEILITLADFLLEDRTRRLPPFERVLHTLLAINFGMALTAFAPALLSWWAQPTGIATAFHGTYSWLFTVFSAGAFAWSIRNTLAVLRLRRPPEWVRNPIAVTTNPDARVVLISGGTGFIGNHLVRRLLSKGDQVIVLTRNADHALDRFGPHIRVITSPGQIQDSDRIDAIINLAGEPILARPWTQARRQKLLSSRVNATRALTDLSARLTRPPRVFVSASAIGYYGIHGDETLNETSPLQRIFQSRLCHEWETVAAAAASSRIAILRIGMVLGRDGGALPQLTRPVRLGLGAILGNGGQWVSWIHIDDLIHLFEFALDTPSLRGAVNAVSPAPATHAQMQRLIAKVLHRPLWMRIPAFVLKAVLGEMAQLLVNGQRVLPDRASKAGFTFKHPNLGEALADLLTKKTITSRQIYYNGECPVCSAEMHHYESIRPDLSFIDSTRDSNGLTHCGLRREHLERRVYVTTSDNTILSGMPAIIALWRQLPGYGWLASLFSLPLLRPASATFYDHVVAPTLFKWAKLRSKRSN